MTAETVQSVSWVLLAIGGFLVVFGGLAVRFAERVIDAKTKQDQQSLIDALKPFENAAANLYPGIGTDAALGELSRKVSHLIELNTPRILTTDQTNTIIKTLADATPTSITISHLTNDPEADEYGIALQSVFEAAKWTVTRVEVHGLDPFYGLRIRVGKIPPVYEAQLIAKAFTYANVQHEISVTPKYDSHQFSILVGHRPELKPSNPN